MIPARIARFYTWLTTTAATPAVTVAVVVRASSVAGALGNNNWLKHVNTDAQGYTLVTLTPGKLVAQFRQVNKLVGASAPATLLARTTTATVTAGVAAVVVSQV